MHESIFDKSVNRWAEWIIRFWIIDIESDHIKLIDKMDVKKKRNKRIKCHHLQNFLNRIVNDKKELWAIYHKKKKKKKISNWKWPPLRDLFFVLKNNAIMSRFYILHRYIVRYHSTHHQIALLISWKSSKKKKKEKLGWNCKISTGMFLN